MDRVVSGDVAGVQEVEGGHPQAQVEEAQTVQEGEFSGGCRHVRHQPPSLLQGPCQTGRTGPHLTNGVSSSSIIQSHLNPISTNFRLDVVNGEIEIFRNGTDHQGPLGQKIFMKEFHICQEENEIFEYFRLNI